MRIKRLYIICPGIDAFSYNIRAISLCSSVNIKLENSEVEKKSLFLTLVTLHKFLRSYLMSAIPSILS